MRNLLATLSILTAARLAGAALMFGLTLLITRKLGPEALADFATAMALASIAAVLMTVGVHAFAPMLAAQYRATEKVALLRGLARTGRRLIMLAGSAGIALGIAVLVGAPNLSDHWRQAILFAMVAAPGMAFVMLHGGLLTGLQKQRAAQLPDTFVRPALALLATFVLIALLPTVQLSAVLMVLVAAVWLTVIVQLIYLSRALPNGHAETDGKKWRGMAPSWLTIALVWDYAIELFLLVAALIALPLEIALLHICFRYRVLAGFGVRSIYAVCQPKIHTAIARNDRHEAARMIAGTNVLSLGYSLAAFFGPGPTR